MSNEKVLLRLKTARGQIDAVIKMIEDGRYCIDISNQLLAIQSLIKNANNEVLSNHLNNCVKNDQLIIVQTTLNLLKDDTYQKILNFNY